jgi:thymidylate kinase
LNAANQDQSAVSKAASGFSDRNNILWPFATEGVCIPIDQATTDLIRLASLAGERVHVMQPPATEDTPGVGGRDLDCFVENLDPRWPLRLPEGWRLVQSLQYFFSRWQWFLEGPHGSEVIDTTEDPYGLETGISSKSLMGSGAEPAPAARAVYLTEKRLYKGMLDEFRWKEIKELAAQDPVFYRDALTRGLGRGFGSRLAEHGLAGNPPDRELVSRYRRRRVLHRLVRPHKAVAYMCLEAWRIARRIVQPTGLMVYVVGPDGSGKTTFTESLLGETKTFFRRHKLVHWTPGVLPPVSRLLRREPGDTSTPHARHPHSRAKSAAALVYYWLDNVIGGWGPLRYTRRRTGLVLVERGWWDMVVDPVRYRIAASPWAITLLGKSLPSPDLIFVLDAPANVFVSRKDEVPEAEVQRQVTAWRELAPTVGDTVLLDARKSPPEVVSDAREHLAQRLESRTAKRIGGGWSSPGNARWMLPRRPAASAVAGTKIFHPMTRKGRIAWRLARAAGSVGAFGLLPKANAAPRDVRVQLAKHVPRNGTYALAHTNHPGRWVALTVDTTGRASALVKLASDEKGAAALQREAQNLATLGARLEPPLTAPRLIDQTDSAIVYEPVDWRLRRRPWELPTDVARAAGRIARSSGSEESFSAHGDFAPWNLLRTRSGWTLIDWEHAGDIYPPLFDLFHFIVQSHALLARPSFQEIQEALSKQGALAPAVKSFVAGFGRDVGDLHAAFAQYLSVSAQRLDPTSADGRVGVDIRERLLTVVR